MVADQSRGYRSQPSDQARGQRRRTVISFCEEFLFRRGRETVAIVGASGSRQVDAARPAGRLDLPSGGSVSLAGESLANLDERRACCAAVSLVSSSSLSSFLPSLNAAMENVMLPLELAGTAMCRRAGEVLAQARRPCASSASLQKHLSGGEQQRVALARAFAPNPRLIFADEPTGNLDAATGHQIIDLMFAINAERGTTLILVTHDEEIAARCGRRLRMHAGEIAEVVND